MYVQRAYSSLGVLRVCAGIGSYPENQLGVFWFLGFLLKQLIPKSLYFFLGVYSKLRLRKVQSWHTHCPTMPKTVMPEALSYMYCILKPGTPMTLHHPYITSYYYWILHHHPQKNPMY